MKPEMGTAVAMGQYLSVSEREPLQIISVYNVLLLIFPDSVIDVTFWIVSFEGCWLAEGAVEKMCWNSVLSEFHWALLYSELLKMPKVVLGQKVNKYRGKT